MGDIGFRMKFLFAIDLCLNLICANRCKCDRQPFTYFVEEGRNRIATDSGIDIARIHVVFGGYRGVAQVEFWIVPAGENSPEIRPEQRDASGEPEN